MEFIFNDFHIDKRIMHSEKSYSATDSVSLRHTKNRVTPTQKTLPFLLMENMSPVTNFLASVASRAAGTSEKSYPVLRLVHLNSTAAVFMVLTSIQRFFNENNCYKNHQPEKRQIFQNVFKIIPSHVLRLISKNQCKPQ